MSESDESVDLMAELRRRFPQMRPIKSSPTMFTYNGIGTALYGGRDADHETGTYVKTLCATVIFVPVFALGSYRVAKADGGGWYFLGKEPLAVMAKWWNILVVLAIALAVGGVMYAGYTGTEAYKSKVRLADADVQVESGEIGAASAVYLELATSSSQREAAKQRLSSLIERATQLKPSDAASAFAAAVSYERRTHTAIRDDLVQRAIDCAAAGSGKDPRGAADVLDAVDPIATDGQHAMLAGARLPVLERLHKAEPEDLDTIVRLAAAYEQMGAIDKARGLLAPRTVLIHGTEGARVLGQIYANEGDYERAYELLRPYAKDRLAALHDAEAAYDGKLNELWDGEIAKLERGSAGDAFYRRYDAASEAEQGQMVNDYIWERIGERPALLAAREKMIDAGGIVPVAMDLGMVMLRRAQVMEDADARRDHLEEAEKVFVGIQSFAGDSDGYKLYLAQVRHWLGKRDEAKSMFDAVLASNDRATGSLLSVGTALRSLGSRSEARALFEEAYEKAPTAEEKHYAARVRALVRIDLDDEIAWLEKSDPSAPDVQAQLANDRGTKASQDGDDDKAAEHYRAAVAIYEKMPESSSKLNNMALVYTSLYGVTGDPKDFDRALTMLEGALELEPDGPIVMHNLANSLLQRAAIGLYHERLDLGESSSGASFGLMSWFYRDASGRAKEADRIAQSRFTRRGLELYEKLLIVRSGDPSLYSDLAYVYNATRDTDAMGALLRRLKAASPDLVDTTKNTLDYYNKVDDDERIEDSQKAVALQRERLVGRDGDKSVNASTLRNDLVTLLAQSDEMGVTIDFDELLSLAERINADTPCSATHSALEWVRFIRASHKVAAVSPEYAAMRERTRRTVPAVYSLLVAAERSDAVRKAVLADPDFAIAVRMHEEAQQRFPDTLDPIDWALVRVTEPQRAGSIAERVRANTLGADKDEIDRLLGPANMSNAVEAYWRALINGASEAEALAPIRAAVKAGAPAPFDLP